MELTQLQISEIISNYTSSSEGFATLCMIDDNLDKEKSSLRNLEMRLNKKVPLLSLEKLCDILVYNLLLG